MSVYVFSAKIRGFIFYLPETISFKWGNKLHHNEMKSQMSLQCRLYKHLTCLSYHIETLFKIQTSSFFEFKLSTL